MIPIWLAVVGVVVVAGVVGLCIHSVMSNNVTEARKDTTSIVERATEARTWYNGQIQKIGHDYLKERDDLNLAWSVLVEAARRGIEPWKRTRVPGVLCCEWLNTVDWDAILTDVNDDKAFADLVRSASNTTLQIPVGALPPMEQPVDTARVRAIWMEGK